jgi:23S rRNA pseudouridine955/2504/2580 synthase
MFLHAARMSFDLGGKNYDFSSPLPDELKAFLDNLRG